VLGLEKNRKKAHILWVTCDGKPRGVIWISNGRPDKEPTVTYLSEEGQQNMFANRLVKRRPFVANARLMRTLTHEQTIIRNPVKDADHSPARVPQ
jgi:hypothetical protein